MKSSLIPVAVTVFSLLAGVYAQGSDSDSEEPASVPQFAISDRLIAQVQGSSALQTSDAGKYLHFSGAGGRGLCLNSADAQSAVDIISNSCVMNKCFTFTSSIRLLKKNFEGTLIHIKSPAGGEFRLHFSKSVQVRMFYQSARGATFERFFYGFPRNQWMRLDLVVCPTAVTVLLDCNRLFHSALSAPPACVTSDPASQVCVGDTVAASSALLGDVRDMTIFEGDQTDTLCPNSVGKDVLVRTVTTLNSRIRELQRELAVNRADMTSEVSAQRRKSAECQTNSNMLYGRVTRITEMYSGVSTELTTCTQMVKNISCNVSGVLYGIGAAVPRPCFNCHCAGADHVECAPSEVCARRISPDQASDVCPRGRVVYQNLAAGTCCDKCIEVPGACNINNKLYLNGESFPNPTPSVCSRTCSCQNSEKHCPVERCPQLPCARKYRFKRPGACCEECGTQDHCHGNPCASRPGNAWSCFNGETSHSCVCREYVSVLVGNECNRATG